MYILNFTYSREEIIAKYNQILSGVNLTWLMIVSIFLFMMQVGFIFMASGAASQKSSTSMLSNHVMVLCTCALIFIVIGAELT